MFLFSCKIKGSCELLMDECILVPLFQNESLCETFHVKMSLIIMKRICRLVQIIWMVSHLDSFWHRVKMLINGLLDECRKRSRDLLRRRANARSVSFRISLRWLTYIVNSVDKTKLSKKKKDIQENKNLLVKCDAEVQMSKYGWLLTPSVRRLNSFSSKIIL